MARRSVLAVWLVVMPATAFGQAKASPTPADQAPVQPPAGATIPQLSLEELMEAEVPTVVGASRFTQQVIDAPASVTVVTGEEIERFGYRTLADLLRSVRGLYVSYDRNYTYLGIRGFSRAGDYNSRILLMVDGHRLNDGIFEMGPIGTEFPLDLSLIDRVEIVRGPSSSLYGTSAFFGIINIITRRGPAARSGVAASVGSMDSYDVRGLFGQSTSWGADVQLAGSYYDSAGVNRVIVDDTGLATVGMDYDQATRFYGAASRGRWSLAGVWSTRTKGIPTGAYGTSLTHAGSQTVDDRGYLDARYQRPLFGTSVTWRGYYDWYRYDGLYLSDPGQPDLVDYADAQWLGSEVTASRRLRSHLLTGGAEYRRDFQQDQGWYYTTTPRTQLLDDRRSSQSWAGYVQDELTLSRRAIVSAGVRVDHFSTVGSAVNPRLALILKPLRRGAFKVLYGTAFRAPNAYELYYYGDATDRLDPERIRTTEYVWEQHLGGPTRIAASVFRYQVRDLIDQVSDETNPDGLSYANVGSAKASGVEAEIERSWPQFQVGASYSFTDAVVGESGERLSNSPRHLARARFSAPLATRRLFVGAEVFASAARDGVVGEKTPGFGLGSFTVSAPSLLPGLRLSVDVHNVLDRRYSDPGAEEHRGPILQDGRTARATLSWRF